MNENKNEATEIVVANKAESNENQENCLGIASLVFGILSILSQFVSVFPLSPYFPFIGVFLALGDKLKNKKMTSNAKIGLILSIVSYAATVLSTILVTIFTITYIVVYCLLFFVVMLAGTAQF